MIDRSGIPIFGQFEFEVCIDPIAGVVRIDAHATKYVSGRQAGRNHSLNGLHTNTEFFGDAGFAHQGLSEALEALAFRHRTLLASPDIFPFKSIMAIDALSAQLTARDPASDRPGRQIKMICGFFDGQNHILPCYSEKEIVAETAHSKLEQWWGCPIKTYQLSVPTIAVPTLL